MEWSPNNPAWFGGVGYGVEITPSGETVTDTGLVIYILDVDTGNRIQEIPVGSYGYSMAWQPNGSYIAAGGESGSRIFDINTGQRAGRVSGPHFDILSISWRSDGRYIATDISVADTHSPDFTRLGTFTSGGATISDVAWSPDGSQILIVNTAGTLASHDPTLLPSYEPLNTPPTADAGADQTLIADSSGFATVTLDGSASFDPDGDIVSYVWTLDDVEIATGAIAEVQLGVGVHEITLTVTDDDGAVGVDSAVVTVAESPLSR